MPSIAYLCDCFPQANQTYVQREISEAMTQGLEIMPCSLADSSASQSDPSLHWNPVWVCDGLPSTEQSEATKSAHPVAWKVCKSFINDPELRWKQAIRCRDIWLENNIQHVHTHFGLEATAVACISKLIGGPTYSFMAHGPDEFDAPVQIGLGTKVLHASFVAAISSFASSQVKRWTPHDHWNKVHVIGCSVPKAFFDHARPVDQSSKNLVCIGRLVPQKGPMLMLEGFAHAIHNLNTDANLIIVGDGPMRDTLTEFTKALDIADRVEFTGWLDDLGVRKQLLSSRAMVLPSFAEGLPLAIMESFAIGRPVLSTYLAGIPELVRPNENGWLVPPGDALSIAHAMDSISKTDAKVLDLFAERGKRAVLTRHFTPTVTATLVKQLKLQLQQPSNTQLNKIEI